MKRIIKSIVTLVIIIAIVGITNISKSFSFNANLSSNDKLVAGQEVKVTLSLSDIDMDDGIRVIEIGKIEVGEEFEEISSSSFSGNTFTSTYSNGGLVLVSLTPVKDSVNAVTLTLKAKQGITSKSSTIRFENIVASSGSNTGDISLETKTITIKANEAAESGEDKGEASTTTPTPTVNTQTKTQETKNNTTKSTSNSKTVPNVLPKAGNTKGIVILPIISIAIVMGIVSFIKYKKIKKL